MSLDQNVPMNPTPANTSSAVALSNAVTVVIGVYRGISGTIIADSISGSPLLTAQLAQLATNRITAELIDRTKAAKALGIIKR